MNRDCNSRVGSLSRLSIDRRALIAGAASLPLLPSVAMADTAILPFSDSHGHFFNASDLPIAGFAKYTLMPEWLGEHPAVGALVDFLAYFVKPAARTAEWEAKHLGEREEWTWRRFGRKAAQFVFERARHARTADLAQQQVSRPELAASYQALRTALAADAGYPLEDIPQLLGTRTDARALDEIIFSKVAEKTEEEGYWGPGEVADFNVAQRAGGLPLDKSQALMLGRVARLVGWAYLILKRRESHLKEYVQRNGASGYAPGVIVNHLVDYDLWIDDCPASRSSHGAQIEFWSLMAAKAKTWQRPVDLRTFAGVCPLKLAIDKRVPGRTPWFETLKQFHRDRKIAGFKLYPPMGFQAIGNADLGNGEFETGGSFRISALDQWEKVAGTNDALGPELDEALCDIYQHSVDAKVPIMAHARKSNDAGPNYEVRADPKYWRQVVERWPIRLQLGHLIDDAGKFVATSGGSDESWSLGPTVAMLTNPDFGSGAQVYGDLGYMPDLIGNRTLARDFFCKLREVFGDAGLRRICYGTDWIMLAQERVDRDYLHDLIRGMRDARYTDTQQADILENNLRRFLAG